MANGWTPERRARQSEAIRRWRPWEQSTGPRTEEGKSVASQNALRHGLRSAEWLEEVHRVNEIIRAVRDYRRSW